MGSFIKTSKLRIDEMGLPLKLPELPAVVMNYREGVLQEKNPWCYVMVPH